MASLCHDYNGITCVYNFSKDVISINFTKVSAFMKMLGLSNRTITLINVQDLPQVFVNVNIWNLCPSKLCILTVYPNSSVVIVTPTTLVFQVFSAQSFYITWSLCQRSVLQHRHALLVLYVMFIVCVTVTMVTQGCITWSQEGKVINNCSCYGD